MAVEVGWALAYVGEGSTMEDAEAVTGLGDARGGESAGAYRAAAVLMFAPLGFGALFGLIGDVVWTGTPFMMASSKCRDTMSSKMTNQQSDGGKKTELNRL